MSTKNDNLELVLAGWIDARRRDDVDAVRRYLHPDVVWQGVRPDLVCPDRDHVLANLRDNNGYRPDVDALDLLADDDQVLLGIRSPDFTEIAGEILDGQIFEVFTIEDGLIVRIDEFKTRDAALETMRQHRDAPAAGASSAASSPAPDTPVTGLIPFVHVRDIEASIAFYELLGLEVTDTHGPNGPLVWAALESGDARIMLASADAPIDPGEQAILFYLYADDLHGLQQHLRAHGAKAGAIRDGTPGPKQEMRLRDPDGYCLMVAQIES
jgi:hypothetical protein